MIFIASKTNERHGAFAYQPLIYAAFLGKHEKQLLTFYSDVFNWTEGNESWYSQESILRQLGFMSPASYQSARKRLEELGWISTYLRLRQGNTHPSVHVKVMLGRDDPDLFLRRGGRTPEEAEAYEALRKHFSIQHPRLCKHPKFKKLGYIHQDQSTKFNISLMDAKKYSLTKKIYEEI